MENKNEIRIYMACLASYNNGILHGRWINALSGEDHIRQEITAMLAASPIEDAEEWAMHDYVGFGSVRLSEYEDIATICEMAEFIQGNDDLGVAVLEHYAGDLEMSRSAVEDHYAGCYRSVAEFAEEMTEQQAEQIPDNLRFYINYEAMAQDMLIGDVFAIELAYDEVHIFWQH